jgi:lipoate-protein ligase A
MKSAMLNAFQRVYGCRTELIAPEETDPERTGLYAVHNRSYEWNYGRTMPFNAVLEDRFFWGDIRMEFDVSEGLIRNLTVYSDAMDASIAPILSDALTGRKFSGGDLCAAVRGTDILFRDDLCALLGTI